MLIQNTHPDDTHADAVLTAMEKAARAIPPAFPLDATVAVNPFLGQIHEDLATASARLARVAGVRLVRERATYRDEIESGAITRDDLAAALAACSSASKPADLAELEQALRLESPAPKALPTLAELAAGASGTDWPELIKRSFGLWAAGHFDRGQALWSPAPARAALDAWRDWARHDLTPEIAGLTGFCSHAIDAPDTADRVILRAAERLGITEANAQTIFHRLLVDLGGWAQHARWLLWEAELAGETDATIVELLAIRLIWEEALLAQYPQLSPSWEETCAAHEQPVAPTRDQVIDAILQEAAERARQRRIEAMLPGAQPREGRPAMQAAFCIDVRSEVFRRALESLDTDIATIGFAGFFGLPVSHCGHGTDRREAHLPVLLTPALNACSHGDAHTEQDVRIRARARRAWGRFRQAAVSSFAFIEAAGPVYGWKLVKDTLALDHGGNRATTEASAGSTNPPPRFEEPLTAEAKAATGAAVLKAMSMTEGHARLVLLVGHGAHVTNNPHESAYHCGACGGQTGEVSARLLASLLNDPETRAGLPGHGIDLAEDTVFVAGLHDT
ncbi:putative inorganic carbon transporter subunit DabA, partial [Saliniramus sp.]|uniref:putative inorganic carbon transporter subunit DabA n=1 Tax=Saliniramus sp. TaxID=2986772 RepID=UPI002C84286B